MFNSSIEAYIKQNFTQPNYSEIYTTLGVIKGGLLIAERTFAQQKVKMIIMHGIIISMPQANANNYLFQDIYKRQILQITAPSYITGFVSIPYFFQQDQIYVQTNIAAGDPLNFTLVYQYIQELAGDKK